MPSSFPPVIVVSGGQSGLAAARVLRELRRALTPKGTLVIVGGDGGGNWTGGFFRGILRPIVSMFVGQTLPASRPRRPGRTCRRSPSSSGPAR